MRSWGGTKREEWVLKYQWWNSKPRMREENLIGRWAGGRDQEELDCVPLLESMIAGVTCQTGKEVKRGKVRIKVYSRWGEIVQDLNE